MGFEPTPSIEEENLSHPPWTARPSRLFWMMRIVRQRYIECKSKSKKLKIPSVSQNIKTGFKNDFMNLCQLFSWDLRIFMIITRMFWLKVALMIRSIGKGHLCTICLLTDPMVITQISLFSLILQCITTNNTKIFFDWAGLTHLSFMFPAFDLGVAFNASVLIGHTILANHCGGGILQNKFVASWNENKENISSDHCVKQINFV